MSHLIVCRSVSDIRRAQALIARTREGCVVASDDLDVHAAARALPGVIDVCWLEDSRSLYQVADDVKRLNELVNEWLRQLAGDRGRFPRRLLFWVPYVEGGKTIQRIQDALLIVGSVQRLLDRYRVSGVTLVAGRTYSWEDDVVAETATAAGVRVVVLDRLRMAAVARWGREAFDLLARVVYSLALWLYSKLNPVPGSTGRGEIVVQLCDSATKHSFYARALAQSLSKTAYTPVVLCWRAQKAARALRRAGIAVDELEKEVSITDGVQSLVRGARTWVAALRRRQDFVEHPLLSHLGVRLGRVLWPSIRFFLLTEAPPRYRMMCGAERYFQRHSPLAMKFWTTVFPEAIIVYESIPVDRKPMVFHAPAFPYDYLDPYQHRTVPVDLELALSEHHKAVLVADGLSRRWIEVVGHDRWDPTTAAQDGGDAPSTRAHAGVPSDCALCILYDPSYVTRGYLSARDQAATTDVLLDFARRAPDAHIMIRPHPSHRGSILEAQVARAGLPNVRIVDNRGGPHEQLRACDVLITKFSTLGIEAMYMGRPVISMLLDRESQFKVFGDAATYLETTDALLDLLTALTGAEYRRRWSDDARRRSARYLEAMFFRGPAPTHDVIAEAVASGVTKFWAPCHPR
jgi:hypothetical protein